MNSRQVIALTGTIFLVGVALMVASAFIVWETRSFINTSKAARGCVVDLEWQRRSGSRRVGSGGGYVTLFTFTDGFGQTHTVRSRGAHNPPTHRIGAPVEVLYRADSPEGARIRSFQTLWLLPVLLAGAGIFFATIGGGGLVAASKTVRGSPDEQTAEPIIPHLNGGPPVTGHWF